MTNILTYMFCGYGSDCKPSQASGLMDMAELGADRLETEYAVVGLLEEFSGFLRVLKVKRGSRARVFPDGQQRLRPLARK